MTELMLILVVAAVWARLVWGLVFLCLKRRNEAYVIYLAREEKKKEVCNKLGIYYLSDSPFNFSLECWQNLIDELERTRRKGKPEK